MKLVFFISRMILISALIIPLLNFTSASTTPNYDDFDTSLDPDAPEFRPSATFLPNYDIPNSYFMPSSSSETYENKPHSPYGLRKDTGPYKGKPNSIKYSRKRKFSYYRNLRCKELGERQAEWDVLHHECIDQVHKAFPNIKGVKDQGDHALTNYTLEMVITEYTRAFFLSFETYLISTDVPNPDKYCEDNVPKAAYTGCVESLTGVFGGNADKALYTAFYNLKLNLLTDIWKSYMETILKSYSIYNGDMPPIFEFCSDYTYKKLKGWIK